MEFARVVAQLLLAKLSTKSLAWVISNHQKHHGILDEYINQLVNQCRDSCMPEVFCNKCSSWRLQHCVTLSLIAKFKLFKGQSFIPLLKCIPKGGPQHPKTTVA